ERVGRYKEYDAMVRKIPYAKKALNVISSEILAPDSITDTAFNIRKNMDIVTKEKENEIKRNILEILETLDFKGEMKKTTKTTCKYGDSFIELLDMNKELREKGVLTESLNLEEDVKKTLNIKFKVKSSPFDKISLRRLIENEEIAQTIVDKAEDQEDKEDKEAGTNNTSLENILLVKHNPGLVVRIGDEVCFGYIIFPKDLLNAPKIENNILYKIANNDHMKEFLRKIKGHLAHNAKIVEEIDNNRDLKIMLTRMYLFYNDNTSARMGNNVAEMRFVPPDMMFHFKIDSDEYDPFGESIFAFLEFDAKMVVLFKTLMALMRLTRSTEKRLIALEMGAEKNVRNIIERWRELYSRRKFSLGDTGGVDTVPSMITTFEDIFIPMKDGKRFVEFDTVTPPAGLDAKIDDYKAMRDSFIAGLDVPPPYLSVEENIESRATLSHENIIFAKTIISYQKCFEITLNRLVRAIYKMVYGEECYFVDVLFPRPRSVELTRESEYFGALKEFKEVIKGLDLSEEKFINKYIDSDLLNKTEKDIEGELDSNANEEEETPTF
ncbi:portal protein, partial [bacterium]|nr:portal protein [bacterium]